MTTTDDLNIHLEDICKCAHLSRNFSGALAEAASVCFEDQGHNSGVRITVQGDYDCVAVVAWNDIDDQIRRTWADEQVATEHGAYGCAMLIVEKLSGLRVIERSRKGTGFDWWLGSADDSQRLFQQKARLEVSGIRQGVNRVAGRLAQKRKQTAQSDQSMLQAVVVVVEFSKPLACVENRA